MEKRILCDDGNCIGVIAPTGHCKTCGKQSSSYFSNSNEQNSEWSRRTLCIDGCCTGVVGENGYCQTCGREYIPEEIKKPNNLSDRRLCDDGRCIGVLDLNGKCKDCGIVSSTYKKK